MFSWWVMLVIAFILMVLDLIKRLRVDFTVRANRVEWGQFAPAWKFRIPVYWILFAIAVVLFFLK